MWALLQVVAIGSCHSNEGLKLEEVALRAEDAKLLLRGGLLGPHQNATLMLTDFPVALLQPLFRQANHNNKYNDNANNNNNNNIHIHININININTHNNNDDYNKNNNNSKYVFPAHDEIGTCRTIYTYRSAFTLFMLYLA